MIKLSCELFFFFFSPPKALKLLSTCTDSQSPSALERCCLQCLSLVFCKPGFVGKVLVLAEELQCKKEMMQGSLKGITLLQVAVELEGISQIFSLNKPSYFLPG